MVLFSERNGSRRTYAAKDLYEAILYELKRWEVYQLLIKQLGGKVYFKDKAESDGMKEFALSGDLNNPAAYFRRELAKSLSFNFENAHDFVHNLPGTLNPTRADGSIGLLFDFLEVIYGLLYNLNYNPKTKRLLTNKKDAQKVFRDEINPDLALFSTPYMMLTNGQIVEISQKPIVELVDQALVIEPDMRIGEKTIRPIQKAAVNYLKRGATLDDKKQAVRDLADSLESIRSKVKEHLLSDDERDLFRVANEFSVRHNNAKQKGEYDPDIWYDWMFHVNLAALLTVIRILRAQK